MIIRLSDIPDEGLKVAVDDLSIENEGIKGHVHGFLLFKKAKNELTASGNIEFFSILTCSRCLTKFQKDIRIPLHLIYLPSEGESGEEKRQLKSGELEVGFYRGNEFDVYQLMKEQVFLHLPIKMLCSEACRGLCPTCGKNLNDGLCACEREVIDERMEKLKELLK